MASATSRRRTTVAVAAAVLVLAAAIAVTILALRDPESVPPPAPVGPPVGVITIAAAAAGGSSVLSVHDPATGAVTRTVQVPAVGLDTSSRRQFSADLSLLTWTDGQTLRAARLQGDRYDEVAAWGSDSVADGISAQYDAPIIAPDGRIWVRAVQQAGTQKLAQVVSVNPAAPAERPRIEAGDEPPTAFDRAGTPGAVTTVALTNDTSANATLLSTSTELLPGDIDISTVDGEPLQYSCPVQLDPDAVACYASTRAGYGTVVEVRVDSGRKTATVRPVAGAGQRPAQALLMSPDRREVRVLTSEGWKALDWATSASTSAPALPTDPKQILDWR